MESQLQQVTTTMVEMQTRMGSMEETIGTMVDKKLDNVVDRLRRDMRDQIQEEMRELSNMLHERIQQFMLMFSC